MPEIFRRRGDTKPIIFRLKNKTTKLYMDIAGFSFRMTVDPAKEPVDSSNNLFTLVGTIVLPSTDGRVMFEPSALQMDITPATYYFDFEVTDAGGYVGTEDLDKFKVGQDISK